MRISSNPPSRTLSPDEARRIYDRVGSFQDTQAFYENPATDELACHSDFERAEAVFEFGCGTGAFAHRLFTERLAGHAAYDGVDVSPTMVELAAARLARWKDRARVALSDGSPRIDAADASFDRFCSTYVFDLLSEQDMRAVVDEAHRLLRPGGLFCATSATHGKSVPSRAVMGVVEALHRLSPRIVAGCRPVELRPLLDPSKWHVSYRTVVTVLGISSEVIVAERA